MDDNKTYILDHTAESIDRKLGLIDENKNLLPYPYETDFSEYPALEDVGDGSILIKEKIENTNIEIPLNHLQLSGGKKYCISLTITDILDKTFSSNPIPAGDLYLKIFDDNDKQLLYTSSYIVFDLSNESSEKAIVVKLFLDGTFNKGILIKPQIEEGTEKTTWVPNMDKIGTYVDRRFNGTNAKLRLLSDAISTMTPITMEVEIGDWKDTSIENGGWKLDESSGYYCYEKKEIAGITEDDNPIVDVILDDDKVSNNARISAWSNILRITTNNGSIKLYAETVPLVDFRIQLKVVR